MIGQHGLSDSVVNELESTVNSRKKYQGEISISCHVIFKKKYISI